MQLTDRLPEPKYKTNNFVNADLEIDNIKEMNLFPKLFMNQSVKDSLVNVNSLRKKKNIHSRGSGTL
jgi:hypothetical protein